MMGVTIFFGYPSKASAHKENWLLVTLNSSSSGCFERLIHEAMSEKIPDILDKIREKEVLAQLHFSELSQTELAIAVQAIRDYLNQPLVDKWQIHVKELWQREFEPMLLIDDRYLSV